ncbi:hypothetical protein GCM10010383_49290 [Streptomyces lomondensis]|uniref:Transposase n=1 Tax=Streptomyces lomondensis TaxID=68229 RepID=A0ABQ2XEN3_9ACTN|nr:hypothetical protein GCM10010383_49290 [Streptomyces lomondensis]
MWVLVVRLGRLPQHAEAHLNWAFITLMTRRLTRTGLRPDSWTKKAGPPAQARRGAPTSGVGELRRNGCLRDYTRFVPEPCGSEPSALAWGEPIRSICLQVLKITGHSVTSRYTPPTASSA